MKSGSLHRNLAVWYPTALLPSSQLQWTHIDPTKALATLTNDHVSVSLEFRFADSGEVTGIYTPARWGTFAGGYRQVPWEAISEITASATASSCRRKARSAGISMANGAPCGRPPLPLIRCESVNDVRRYTASTVLERCRRARSCAPGMKIEMVDS
jgi:hypothetical protein